MRKIIIPIDFSTYSENALKSAAFLAKKNNAELIAVHMLELSHAIASQSESYLQEQTLFLYKLTEKKFEDFLKADYLSGIKVTPIIKHFKIFSELDDLAKEENADLIIMGSKGTSGMKEIFIGSNTEKVIRHSKVPVIIIKEEAIKKDIKNALFACDFSNNDIEPYLEAKKLFNAINCSLKLVYVITPTSKFKSTGEIKDRIKKFMEEVGEEASEIRDNVAIITDYSVEEGIFYFAKTSEVDIIALATHGRKGVAHFFEGSISEDIANHSTLPVITFKI
ncbi:Nucleotide-binding universal stress protein, UspA family [Tenacibaculum sp. MAR_2009_124]|uniref:universal stress protein n=1 Tax=Tenacibaculum sp. MAR_2009_124 TaxID=1250059 RepID=UPI00089822A6|nr:universal stress protein [Tenacibaculum sp. MAR_2009_124]SEB74183.1 Nucleotide-binding universal stress protein, UspA family [Tenacibaculum sp. MAR_2009_124]